MFIAYLFDHHIGLQISEISPEFQRLRPKSPTSDSASDRSRSPSLGLGLFNFVDVPGIVTLEDDG